MNIFNKNNYLEKIINALNEQYRIIYSIDRKINHYVDNHTQSTTSVFDNKFEREEINEYIKEITDENSPSICIDEINKLKRLYIEKADELNDEIEIYKNKIEKLTKDVAFQENRSNKNFEEVKRLRNTIDNILAEKRNLEKKNSLIESEIKTLKDINESKVDVKELDNLKEENKLLTDKINSFDRLKEKLNKEIEFQKNRSNSNWEELKILKVEYNKLLEENKKNTEKGLKELQSLRNIKNAICSNERGATFWKAISNTIGELDDCEYIENVQAKTNVSYNLTIAGITKTRAEWRKEWDIPKSRLRYRIEQKWDNLEILFGKDFKYSDAKKFYEKYPDALLYDTLDNKIKKKLKEETCINLYTEKENQCKEKLLRDKELLCILATMGKTGLSRVIELKETDNFKKTFVTTTGNFSQGTLSKKINELNNLGIIDIEQINTGRKGGYENIYCLSDLGKQIYKLIFLDNPIESEKESIGRQYNSLEHGYFIKTVAKEFINKGYKVDKVVDMQNLEIKNKTKKSALIEADLIITKNSIESIVLCELGNTTEYSLSDKLDKLIGVTNTISFIMNNQESLNKISSKVDKWITKKGREKLKGYTFRFTTIDTLKKKEVWQNKGPF